MIYKIKLPATSANIGIGFDTLGMALNLYNVYEFEPSKYPVFKGFDAYYEHIETNTIYQTYKKTYETFHQAQPFQDVCIHQTRQDVPISRGLGSSATQILAGVFASNHIHQLGLDVDACVAYAATLEGHPDNIYACAYGGFLSVIHHNDTYLYRHFDVSSTFDFNVFIPHTKGVTKHMRDILPKKVSYEDVVHNLSRMSWLSDVLKHGDYETLKVVLEDKLHEPYRFKLLPELDTLKAFRDNYILILSGSGPSLLCITKKRDKISLPENAPYTLKKVNISQGLEVTIK